MPTQLTLPETMKLGQLEMIVQRGLEDFVRVGNALLEIRDSKLYRENYTTFAGYCKAKWNISRSQAYELIDSAELVESLPENVRNSGQITNTSQALELAKVPEEKRAEVIEKAKQAGPVTAKGIREAAAEVVEPKPEAEAEPDQGYDDHATERMNPAEVEADEEPEEPKESKALRAVKAIWEENPSNRKEIKTWVNTQKP